MRGARKIRSYLVLLLTACLLACVTMHWINSTFLMESSLLKLKSADTFNTGWSIVLDGKDHPVDTISRSVTPYLRTIVLHNTLPDTLDREPALAYRINDEATRVLVGGEEIFSYGYENNNPIGRSYGTVWLTVPLTSDMAGQPLTVEITALSERPSEGNYMFYLDGEGEITATIVGHNAQLLLTVVVGYILAILLLFGGIFSMNSGLNLTRPRIFLALFVFTGQSWVLAQADLLQFVLGNKATAHFFAHAVFMLMPVFFALYLSALLQSQSRQYRALVSVFSGYLLLRIVLYFFNILDISAYTALTHLMMALGMTYAFVLFLLDRHSKANPIVRMGVIVFFAFAICAIAHYWQIPYLNTDIPHYALLLGTGIDILMLFYYCALLLNHRYLASSHMRFEQQAYTDAMTQVNNRTAYDYIAPTLKPDAYPRLTLFMFDMNTLKQVNDTLGHLAGDKLVCALVNYLQLAFGAIGKIYRFGGDEFVVVIENAPLDEVHAAHAEFDKMIREHREHGGNEISVAIGMASRQEREYASLSIDNLLRQADKAMYTMKTIMKSRPSAHEFTSQRLKQIDPLTGILTFDAFKACVYDALSAHNYRFPCIVTMDLHSFDGYNILFGWDEGNQLLQKMAAMAMKLCGEKGFCAHGTADHFWVFADMPDLETLTQHIRTETALFQAGFDNCLPFPCFGIYCISDQNLPVSNMCSRAASTQKRIKGRLDVLYSVYDDEYHQQLGENIKLLSYMRKAIDNNEHVLCYKPIFTAIDHTLVGAEAMRWPEQHSTNDDFNRLFERSGLILTMDWFVLEKTCAELRRMLDKGLACVPICTSFSRLHVYEADCLARVRHLLEQYNLPPHLLGLSFTGASHTPDSGINDKLHALYGQLRELGVRVMLDDVNSNLSSLCKLNELNADAVKIQCSLAVDSAGMARELSAFHFTLDLCRSYGIMTLVENISDAKQLEIVSRCSCDMLQGNYLSPPLPTANFESLLMQQQDRQTRANG